MENIAPVRSMRVDGPGAWRISKFSTKSADTICMAARVASRPVGYTAAPDGWWKRFVAELPARTGKLGVVKADGGPHIAPIWVDLDGDQLVFTTPADSIRGKSILRDGRVVVCFDDDRPPFSFATVAGTATTSTDPEELLYWATRIAGRYMGAELADEYGRRNGVPPEIVVRVTPTKVTAAIDVTG